MRKLAMLLALIPSVASAADLMPVKAARPATASNWYDPAYSGFFGGLTASAIIDKKQLGALGNIGPDTFAAGAGVGLLGGYAFGMGDKAVHVEGNVRWSNVGVTGMNCAIATPCAINDKWTLGGSALYVTDASTLLSVFAPFLPSGNSIFSGLPFVPNTSGVSHMYIGATVEAGDISASVGAALGKKWEVRYGPNVGLLVKLSNGVVTDTRLTAFAPTSNNIGPLRSEDGWRYMASFSVKR